MSMFVDSAEAADAGLMVMELIIGKRPNGCHSVLQGCLHPPLAHRCPDPPQTG
jgi:hypothetical protein